ncbi:MAG: putative Fe-S cluster assembly protein SufT [Verrucomicrobia bacterium]|nr:putative Fe-S cluster assembly protein SufT [Verrucomicrobiota bacterium]
MATNEQIILARDCGAIQIPAGNKVTLPKGTPVIITQTLGGTYTVQAPGGLCRIEGKDADALGITETEQEPAEAAAGAGGGDLGEDALFERQVWGVLKSCYDPEIPVNIVDLGLIYDMKVSKVEEGRKVDVKMTLTARGCGMGPAIAGDAQQKLLTLDGVEEANVELVWDPPWNPAMISPEGKKRLGIE